jgi:hypothetical protein
MTGAEEERLRAVADGSAAWQQWGPYLAERQWGTVREDYSPGGSAWSYLPHDQARSRAYRWGEDGLLGLCDDESLLCLAPALWNGRDAILKERLFGLTGEEGNHGEDVKEAYFFLDSTPTHSYMTALYKYPQAAFPYAELVEENRRRERGAPEYELWDTGVFADERYFDVLVGYAKAAPRDVLVRYTVSNRGPEAATLWLLPTLWCRNTWSWGSGRQKPRLTELPGPAGSRCIRVNHPAWEGVRYWLVCEGAERLLFTENESNAERLWGVASAGPYVKDAFHRHIVGGDKQAVNPTQQGTKAAAVYRLELAAGETRTVRLRLSDGEVSDPFADFDALFDLRKQEADEFYAALNTPEVTDDMRAVQRHAFAGLLWSKQFYYYEVPVWLDGDPAMPSPPPERKHGRNSDWSHLNTSQILSMPDTWEYPWFAAWDMGFQCIALALIDPAFAKSQLVNLTREWYMHPNGQLPAYEWAFGDVNPPVHAWAAWRVYRIERRMTGKADTAFLERVFHKLLLNFTWWVNRKDVAGRNVFQGGFLGMDNIGVFDRSAPLPNGEYLEQSDGTAWMGMYSLNMLTIALELARTNPVYEDIATKFFEHFLYIAGAMNNIGGEQISLWDDQDNFFYDVLALPNGQMEQLKVRSLVGLIPLLTVETVEPATLDALSEFRKRLEWFLEHRPQLAGLVSRWYEPGAGERRLLALVRGFRMTELLKRMLDPNEFLSDYGVRSLSKFHLDHPFTVNLGGVVASVDYEPGESTTGLFGGNSNWRGPVWFPVNYLLIEALQRFHYYYGDDFKVECPTGSGQYMTLNEVANDLSHRLMRLFLRDASGRRPFRGNHEVVQTHPNWRDCILFYEYFHGDSGAGLGSSHQTGWTGLVAKLIEQQGRVMSGEL